MKKRCNASPTYYGRDAATQRLRVQRSGDISERLENGQLIAGRPDTVLTQIRRIREALGVGILDLVFYDGRGHDATLRALELFGTQVLPRIRDF